MFNKLKNNNLFFYFIGRQNYIFKIDVCEMRERERVIQRERERKRDVNRKKEREEDRKREIGSG